VLAQRVNKAVECLFRVDPHRERRAKAAIKTHRDAQRLAQAIADSVSASSVREELTATQAATTGLEQELCKLSATVSPPVVHPEMLKRYVCRPSRDHRNGPATG
jgi:hypothetical protein